MTAPQKTKKPFRQDKPQQQNREIAGGIIIFRRTNEGIRFLLLYHGRGYWNFPKGKIEREEKSLKAALRETKEETGLSQSNLRLVKRFKAHERFSFYRDKKKIFKLVILYLAETNICHIKLSDEHSGYGWFSFEEAKKILSRYKENLTIITNAHSFLQKRSGKPKK
jgi:bis(5'-nucleosidyl)-tetraphosphatase